jgi:hypothetical protein
MPLYRCEKCGCVENTALGNYWSRNIKSIWPDEFLGKALCSECSPQVFRDGTRSDLGEWHDEFPKRSADGMLIDQEGFLWSREEQMPRHCRVVGAVGDNTGINRTRSGPVE